MLMLAVSMCSSNIRIGGSQCAICAVGALSVNDDGVIHGNLPTPRSMMSFIAEVSQIAGTDAISARAFGLNT